MKLSEIEHKTELEQLAIKDGIETSSEYNAWLLGYMAGIRALEASLEVSTM
jgi:hypothetical protein